SHRAMDRRGRGNARVPLRVLRADVARPERLHEIGVEIRLRRTAKGSYLDAAKTHDQLGKQADRIRAEHSCSARTPHLQAPLDLRHVGATASTLPKFHDRW